MQLTTEELDPIDDVTQEALREILESDVFGKFVILAESETSFIQVTGSRPMNAHFLKQNDSDPWKLEYHDALTDTHFRANGYQTLNEVIDVFTRFLICDDSWRISIGSSQTCRMVPETVTVFTSRNRRKKLMNSALCRSWAIS